MTAFFPVCKLGHPFPPLSLLLHLPLLVLRLPHTKQSPPFSLCHSADESDCDYDGNQFRHGMVTKYRDERIRRCPEKGPQMGHSEAGQLPP